MQTAGKLLDTGLNTVQSTLLLKKQIEVEKVQEDLDVKRRQFADRMAACKLKEEELKKKQQQVNLYEPISFSLITALCLQYTYIIICIYMYACVIEFPDHNFQIRDRVGKFEKFIKENDAKRRRAIQKYQTELKLKDQKTRELDLLWQEMEQLKSK